MKLNYKLILFTALLVVAAVFSKLYFSTKLEWSGFSPIMAIALLAGMIIKDKSASFLLPLASLFISDIIIEVLFRFKLFPYEGFYGYQLLNYALLLVTTLVGWLMKGNKMSRVIGGAIIAPTLFFALSNLTVWFSASFYTKDLNGLTECYVAALPFYLHSLIATFVFLLVFLFSYNYITKSERKLLVA